MSALVPALERVRLCSLEPQTGRDLLKYGALRFGRLFSLISLGSALTFSPNDIRLC